MRILGQIEDKVRGVNHYLEHHLRAVLIAAVVFSILVRLYLINLYPVVRFDAFQYLVKGIEISRGDFSPILSRPSGWSYLLAPFLSLGTSMIQKMAVARVASLVMGCLCIVPFALIAKRLLSRKGFVVAVFMFAFSFQLILSVVSVHSEPFFTFILLWCIYFLVKSHENQNYLILAAIFGAIMVYIRQNGIIMLPVIIVSAFLMRKQTAGFRWRYLACAALVFSLLIIPGMLQRSSYFGSPFNYGTANRRLMEDPKTWNAENIPSPTLGEFISSHSLSSLADRFIVKGALRLLRTFLINTVTVALLVYFIYGIASRRADWRFYPFYALFPLFLAPLIPVWYVAPESRFFYPLVPLIIILSVAGMMDLLKHSPWKDSIAALSLAAYITMSLGVLIVFYIPTEQSREIMQDTLEMGQWISENAGGTILGYAHLDMICMHLDDVRLGNESPTFCYSNSSDIRVIGAGAYFDNISKAMEHYHTLGVTYIEVDDQSVASRPFLSQVGNQRYAREVYTNANENHPMNISIYEIDWALYEKSKH